MARNSGIIFVVLLVAGVGGAYYYRDSIMRMINGIKIREPEIASFEDLPNGYNQDPSVQKLSDRIDAAISGKARAFPARRLKYKVNDRFTKLNKSRN